VSLSIDGVISQKVEVPRCVLGPDHETLVQKAMLHKGAWYRTRAEQAQPCVCKVLCVSSAGLLEYRALGAQRVVGGPSR
jgi:hypothetical protein